MASIIYLFILVIGLITYQGFRNPQFTEKYIFHVDRVLVGKEYYRVFSSGFLHADWRHFIFNLIALSSFGIHIIASYGFQNFAIIYFLSLICGNLLSLYIHRNHGSYRALGASGAISGIIFASIAISPTSDIGFILLPFALPAWIMGALFVAVSIWGIKTKAGNVGHDAHLGGAVAGMLIGGIIDYRSVISNLWVYLLLLLPALIFIVYIIKNPNFLILEKISVQSLKDYIPGNSMSVKSREEQLNELLDKINEDGFESLSQNEKKKLKELSGEH